MGYNILFYACAGGIIGAISALISRAVSSDQKGKIVNLIIFAVLFGTFFGLSKQMNLPGKLRVYFDPDYRVILIMEEEMKDVYGKVNERGDIVGKNGNEVKAYFRALGSNGLKRLPDKWLVKWNDLRLKLAENSNHVCVAFWTGNIDEKKFLSAMASLEEEDIRQWAKLMAVSARSELDKTTFPHTTQEDLANGLEVIKFTLPENEQDRFWKILESGLSANEEDSCWVMKKILKGANDISNEMKLTLLRSLSKM